MSTVNLGTIKHAPIVRFYGQIKHVWKEEEAAGNLVKLDIPFTFEQNKTYIVLIRSYSGTVNIDGSDVSVSAIDLLTNRLRGIALSGGVPFPAFGINVSFAVTFPDYSSGTPAVYILRPQKTDAASLFAVGIYEL